MSQARFFYGANRDLQLYIINTTLDIKSKNAVSKAKSSTCTVYCSTLREHHMYKPTVPKQVI